MKEVRLHFSEPLVKEVVRVFVARSLWRGFGVGFFVLLALLLAMLGCLIWQGDRSWLVGLLAALPIFVALFVGLLYLAHRRNTLGRFRAMQVPEGTFAYHEENFTLASELGNTTLPWSAVTEVWRYPHFWLLLFSRSQFATLPLADLDAETRAFIVRKTGR